jgi:abortive infection bacteriophage resistance protein
MGSTATSISQQIQKLSDRGMILDMTNDKIEEILLDIGYYRLGFYWNPFEKDRSHDFIEGTKFSDVVALYYLDVDLRNILLKCLNRIEINFRTKLVYYASNRSNSPAWFADKKVMSQSFVDSFSKHYDATFIKNNGPIKKHHSKYINDRYAPAWKTLEFFTFGTIFKIFRSLNDETLKLEIYSKYGINHSLTFINYISTIIFIRNTCAHGGVLFDLNTPTAIRITPLIHFRNYSNNIHSLDSCIKVILYFLDQISNDRKKEIEAQLDDLFRKNSGNQTIKKIIENKIGYINIAT